MEIAYLLGRKEEEILDMDLGEFTRWHNFFIEDQRARLALIGAMRLPIV
jgi:hypothetical protein